MGSPISIDPGSVRAGLICVIKNFSQYLCSLKQTGMPLPNISEETNAIIKGWGNDPSTRTAFFFEGPENAEVFIIDSQTSFFKGETGQLLVKILTAMGLSFGDVLICSSNAPMEVQKNIRKLLPKVIITLGEEAGRVVLGPRFSLEELGGKFHDFEGIKVMPTFHPSLLLEQPQYKRQVWEDMKLVMEYTGLKHGA